MSHMLQMRSHAQTLVPTKDGPEPDTPAVQAAIEPPVHHDRSVHIHQGRSAADLGALGFHAHAGDAHHEATDDPGVARPVQAHGGAMHGGAGMIKHHAAHGLTGPSQQLPHLDRIQAAFGRFDVSGVAAHVGGPAAEAAGQIGADAYASGNSVAFRDAPDLFTAAHEAAHVVQQRAGVSLLGGVGEAGDPYERHADAVAAEVVAGRSAEATLAKMAGGGGATSAVQCKPGFRSVSGQTKQRLRLAERAIDYTKRIFPDGAGNQRKAIEKSHGASTRRRYAARDQKSKFGGQHTAKDKPSKTDSENLDIYRTALKATHFGGGHCDEFAAVTFDWLRENAPNGTHITKTSKSGLDHAFCVIGDLANENGDELVVADAWPVRPQACVWRDFFGYTGKRSKLEHDGELDSDGQSGRAIHDDSVKFYDRPNTDTPMDGPGVQGLFDSDTRSRTHWYCEEDGCEHVEEDAAGACPSCGNPLEKGHGWIWNHKRTIDDGKGGSDKLMVYTVNGDSRFRKWRREQAAKRRMKKRKQRYG